MIFVFSLHIFLGGDVMLDNWVEERFLRGERGFGSRLNIPDSALFLVNLEGPFGRDGKKADKEFTFLVDPSLVEILREMKVDGVTLANNHMMDYGPEALYETMKVLKKEGIKFCGAGSNLDEALKPAIFEMGNEKVALLSFSNTFPESFYAGKDKPGTAQGSYANVRKGIELAKEEGASLIIVAFHWGGEKLDTAKAYQRHLARYAIDMGADVVFGHHPHVLQPVEIYKNRVIAYSLGNLLFSSYGVGNGGLLEIVWDGGIKEVYLWRVEEKKKFYPERGRRERIYP